MLLLHSPLFHSGNVFKKSYRYLSFKQSCLTHGVQSKIPTVSTRKETPRLVTVTEIQLTSSITSLGLLPVSYSFFPHFQLLLLISFSIVCYVTEGIGVLSGFTLLHTRSHAFASLSHFCGAIAIFSMTLNWWGISAFPIIFIITTLIPVGIDIVNCTLRWYMLPVGLR